MNLSSEKKLGIETNVNTGMVDPSCNASQDFPAENCTKNISNTRIKRPEWTELFPNAEF